MRLAVTILLTALILSGCVANWPSNRTGPRWTSGPNMQPTGNEGLAGDGQGNHAMGPGPLNY